LCTAGNESHQRATRQNGNSVHKVAAPRALAEESMKLGMPGDSDRLPNTAPWSPSMWKQFTRISPNDPAWPNTLAICAIMKSEHPEDVVEWVNYHKCALAHALLYSCSLHGQAVCLVPCSWIAREGSVAVEMPARVPDWWWFSRLIS
jgi:hypothetical protein